MTMLERIRRRAAVLGGLLAGLAAAALPAAAAEIGTLTVVSSFPPSLYEPFRAAFEARHPQWRLRIINRKTSSAIDYVRSDRGAQVDVFWASAPDAFEVLKTHGLLAVLRPRAVDAPKTIGGFPINDPDGHYLGFALSGYGVFWNQDYLERHGLPPPQDWRDLTDPRYARHIALTPPSRSGTMHLMVEAMLQSLGWEQGWALLQEIGANAATLTARSFSVVEGVARQRFGLGITIDFLGLTYSAKNPHSHFSYPQGGIFLPASVAILKASPNRAAAERSEERRVGKEARARRSRDQAEDGIRDFHVTGVQTCALPISQLQRGGRRGATALRPRNNHRFPRLDLQRQEPAQPFQLSARRHFPAGQCRHPESLPQPGRCREIGRASCRERG